ncbi:hypothetical protein KY320_03720, partial [Candidatus Woesearchaeota archaeon]|nr:hypothetical protein [Candidatus Woesearchaeota archaeon]
MKKLAKKGDFIIREHLGELILVLVLAIVLLALYFTILSGGSNIADQEACKRSVDLAPTNLELTPSGKLVDSFGNSVQLECQTEYINYNTEDAEEIKHIIAEKMSECWSMYGRGEKPLFETEDGAYCAVCSMLTFDEEVQITGLTTYLQETKMHPGTEQTYWDYLVGVDVVNFEKEYYENSELEQYDHFTTDFPLAVMFIMDKD